MDWWLWLIIAVVAVLVIAGAVYMAKQGADAKRRHDAESLREGVREQDIDVQRKEAAAQEARANADEARLKAERLEAEVSSDRSDMEEHLQKADHIDPDVDTDADQGEHRRTD